MQNQAARTESERYTIPRVPILFSGVPLAISIHLTIERERSYPLRRFVQRLIGQRLADWLTPPVKTKESQKVNTIGTVIRPLSDGKIVLHFTANQAKVFEGLPLKLQSARNGSEVAYMLVINSASVSFNMGVVFPT